MADGPSIQERDDGVVFKVFIQPRASKNNVAGLREDAVKIRITAPPVEGAANKALISFLSKRLGIRKSDIQILSGDTGRTKRILVMGEETGKLKEKIEALLP